jgi:hypothetical protein
MGRKSNTWDDFYEAVRREDPDVYKYELAVERVVVEYFNTEVTSRIEELIEMSEGTSSSVLIGLRLARRELNEAARLWATE